jgi:hypothetical protein
LFGGEVAACGGVVVVTVAFEMANYRTSTRQASSMGRAEITIISCTWGNQNSKQTIWKQKRTTRQISSSCQDVTMRLSLYITKVTGAGSQFKSNYNAASSATTYFKISISSEVWGSSPLLLSFDIGFLV